MPKEALSLSKDTNINNKTNERTEEEEKKRHYYAYCTGDIGISYHYLSSQMNG